jgi:hypothetical protein
VEGPVWSSRSFAVYSYGRRMGRVVVADSESNDKGKKTDVDAGRKLF